MSFEVIDQYVEELRTGEYTQELGQTPILLPSRMQNEVRECARVLLADSVSDPSKIPSILFGQYLMEWQNPISDVRISIVEAMKNDHFGIEYQFIDQSLMSAFLASVTLIDQKLGPVDFHTLFTLFTTNNNLTYPVPRHLWEGSQQIYIRETLIKNKVLWVHNKPIYGALTKDVLNRNKRRLKDLMTD